MFKNREMRVRLAKIDPTQTEDLAPPMPLMTPEEANAILQDTIKRTAVAVIVVMASAIALDTARQLAIKILDPK